MHEQIQQIKNSHKQKTMKTSMSMAKNVPTFPNLPNYLQPWYQKEKVIVVMGATGTGKSKLSIDLATRFPAEVINSDKIQLHQGLEIVTNKITDDERCGVPHHLLGIVDPTADFRATEFCHLASSAVRSIGNRGQLPIIAGGSNSYIEALIDGEDTDFKSRYECCFLWVDVDGEVLNPSLKNRVDKMVEIGMVEELEEMFDPHADYTKGIRKAIGVPEFDRYFRCETSSRSYRLLQEAIENTKMNTLRLACRQIDKIRRLKDSKGWKIRRLDATEVLQKKGADADEAWEENVVGPALAIVNQFLNNYEPRIYDDAGFLQTIHRRPALAGRTC